MHEGWFEPEQVDHFLCHYSSQKFAGVVEDLMHAAGLAIPRERWYSNLTERGNTGAASIFIMLADFLRERELKPGQQIFCFVPESGRFMVAFMLFEVVKQRCRRLGCSYAAAADDLPDAVPRRLRQPGARC